MLKYENENHFHFKIGDNVGYNTKQGERIAALLKSAEGEHLTADEIARRLLDNGEAVGKSTVYRWLEKQVGQGTVRRFAGDKNESACYQYTGGTECKNHYHLKCSVCGRLLHVDCEFLDQVAEHILEHHGFVLSEEKTVLYGVCADCRKAQHH